MLGIDPAAPPGGEAAIWEPLSQRKADGVLAQLKLIHASFAEMDATKLNKLIDTYRRHLGVSPLHLPARMAAVSRTARTFSACSALPPLATLPPHHPHAPPPPCPTTLLCALRTTPQAMRSNRLCP